MAAIPQTGHDMIDRIYEAIEKKETNKFRLTRVGASGIGAECMREIWYGWRGYANVKFDGRMLRLFRTGHLQEDRIVNDLKLAGFQVWEIDESHGGQWTYNDPSGHFVAKLDGVIKGVPGAEKTPHTLEIKTHSKKSFEELPKIGVQKSKPKHFAQMQAGMLFSGIHRALYVALCKDDERYYVERIVFDPAYCEELEKKIVTVIGSTLPPSMIADKEDSHACKWCDYKEVCKGGGEPLRTCRSCEFAEVKEEGIWACGLLNTVLDPDDQLKACEHYSVIRG